MKNIRINLPSTETDAYIEFQLDGNISENGEISKFKIKHNLIKMHLSYADAANDLFLNDLNTKEIIEGLIQGFRLVTIDDTEIKKRFLKKKEDFLNAVKTRLSYSHTSQESIAIIDDELARIGRPAESKTQSPPLEPEEGKTYTDIEIPFIEIDILEDKKTCAMFQYQLDNKTRIITSNHQYIDDIVKAIIDPKKTTFYEKEKKIYFGNDFYLKMLQNIYPLNKRKLNIGHFVPNEKFPIDSTSYHKFIKEIYEGLRDDYRVGFSLVGVAHGDLAHNNTANAFTSVRDLYYDSIHRAKFINTYQDAQNIKSPYIEQFTSLSKELTRINNPRPDNYENIHKKIMEEIFKVANDERFLKEISKATNEELSEVINFFTYEKLSINIFSKNENIHKNNKLIAQKALKELEYRLTALPISRESKNKSPTPEEAKNTTKDTSVTALPTSEEANNESTISGEANNTTKDTSLIEKLSTEELNQIKKIRESRKKLTNLKYKEKNITIAGAKARKAGAILYAAGAKLANFVHAYDTEEKLLNKANKKAIKIAFRTLDPETDESRNARINIANSTIDYLAAGNKRVADRKTKPKKQRQI